MKITRIPLTVGVAAAVVAGVALPVTAASAADPAPLPPGGSLVSVAPVRVLDTRVSSPGDKAVDVTAAPAAALAGVDPSTVSAVLLNVTVVGALGTGYVVVGAGAGTSNGNFVGLKPSATLALVADPGAAAVPIHLSAPADVVVDVQGYVTTPEAATSASFTPVRPVRVADSRKGQGVHAFGTGETQDLEVSTAAGLPDDATAVVANVTIARAAADTYITAWSGNDPRPMISTVNAAVGTIVANRAVVPLAADGSISLFNYAKRTDVVVDVVGYLAPDAAGSYYTPAPPVRLLDARTGAAVVGVSGDAKRLAENASALWLTVVGDRPSTPGYITIQPSLTPAVGTSDLNTVPGRAVSNAGPAAPGTDGGVYIASKPASRVVVDFSGAFRTAAAVATQR